MLTPQTSAEIVYETGANVTLYAMLHYHFIPALILCSVRASLTKSEGSFPRLFCQPFLMSSTPRECSRSQSHPHICYWSCVQQVLEEYCQAGCSYLHDTKFINKQKSPKLRTLISIRQAKILVAFHCIDQNILPCMEFNAI